MMCEEKLQKEEKALPDEALDAITGGEDAPKADTDKEWKPNESADFWDNVKDFFGLKK